MIFVRLLENRHPRPHEPPQLFVPQALPSRWAVLIGNEERHDHTSAPACSFSRRFYIFDATAPQKALSQLCPQRDGEQITIPLMTEGHPQLTLLSAKWQPSDAGQEYPFQFDRLIGYRIFDQYSIRGIGLIFTP